MILNLVSGPRNVSTALMYSFAQREDTEVVDEPFYAVYLKRSGAHHPGADAVLKALPTDETLVRAHLTRPRTKPVVFVKNMAHHMEVLDDPFIEGATNIFLIRDPRQILLSYSAVMADPQMRDIGIAYQYALFNALRSRGTQPLVVDSGSLVSDPPGILSELCHACGLPYDQRMEHWPAGPKPYDGVWARYWYANAHHSTRFEARTAMEKPLPSHLESLCKEATKVYNKLRPFSLKA